MFGEDMASFFEDADDWLRRRAGVGEVPFKGIAGAISREVLQGYALGNVRELRYASGAVELRPGDTVVQQTPAGAATWRVAAGPELQNDGAESVVQLAAGAP